MSVRRLVLVLLAWLALAGMAWAQAEQPVPPLDGRVIDRTGTLDERQRAALDAKLAAIETGTGSQVVVLLVPTTQPEDIAAYAQRVADQWKIGRRDVGDGLVVLVAKDDRRMRIEVAKALEGAIPDLAAKQIIDGAMRPAFRLGDYAGGLNAAVDQIGARIRAENLPAPQREPWGSGEGSGLSIEELAIFFFAAVPIVAAVLTGILGRRLGSLATSVAVGGLGYAISTSVLIGVAAAVVALILIGVFGIGASGGPPRPGSFRRGGGPVIWGGGGGGFGGGGRGGGGGFSSGGGGDFGGGGASGSW